MEAGDGGEEEGMNDGEVEENMIVVCPLPMSRNINWGDRNQILKKVERNVQEKQQSQMRRV
jgi:hypothetical protein